MKTFLQFLKENPKQDPLDNSGETDMDLMEPAHIYATIHTNRKMDHHTIGVQRKRSVVETTMLDRDPRWQAAKLSKQVKFPQEWTSKELSTVFPHGGPYDHRNMSAHLRRLHPRDLNLDHQSWRALEYYSGQGSGSINRYLVNHSSGKGGGASQVSKHIAALNSAIDKAKPLDKPIHTYSGIGRGTTGYLAKVIKHGFFHTPAFTSSSLDWRTASDFSNPVITGHRRPQVHGKVDHYHIIHFELPKGYKGGRYIDPLTETGEDEFLLKPDQYWKVKGHTIQKDSWGDQRTHIWHVVPMNKPKSKAIK